MSADMDAFSASVLGPDSGDGEEHRNADEVYAQLGEDFPDDAVEWVRDVSWEGPIDVPITDVDMTGRDRWRASREPEKVGEFAAIMRRGGDELKPLLLVHWPGAPKLFCVDGHHRLLASDAAGVPAKAFIAEVPQAAGPWLTMHARQHHGPSAGSGGVRTRPGRHGMLWRGEV